MKVVGRQKELAQLERWFQQKGSLAVTIHGEPGIGKTTLARVALARFGKQFEHGAKFVDVTELSGRDPLSAGLSRALGLARSGELLIGHLRERSVLLVIDEADAVPGAAQELAELLATSANLKLLITARSKLGLWGEEGLALGPLGDAAMLAFPPSLVERAGSNPLVLQLAQHLPLEQVPPSPPLDAVLKLALAALPPREREQLGLFSAYRGGFDGAPALLEQRGLVVRDGARFDLLPVVRKAVLDPKAREPHAARFIALAREVGARLDAAPSTADLDLVEAELPNVRAAAAYLLEQNQLQRGLELVVPLGRFFDLRAQWADGRRWLEAFSREPSPLRASAINHAGLLAFRQGDLPASKALHERALESAGPLEELDAVDRLQWCAIYQGRVPEGAALAERGYALAQQLGDPVRLARAKGQRAWALFELGKRTESEKLYAEAVADLESQRDKAMLAYMLNALGEVLRGRTRLEHARAAYERCLQLARELKAPRQAAVALYNLALVAKGTGDRKRGLQALVEAIDVSHKLGNQQTLPTDLIALATFAALAGKAKVGAKLLGAAEEQIKTGAGIAFADRDDLTSAAGLLRAHLGQGPFDALRAEGSRMTGDGALQLGLQSLK